MWTIHAVSRVFVQQQKAWFDQRKSTSNGTTASLSSVASGGGAVAPLNPTEHERCSQSSSMMAEMLVRIASDPNSFRHPLLVRTIADTMASLATWIDLHSELTATTTALQVRFVVCCLLFVVCCLLSIFFCFFVFLFFLSYTKTKNSLSEYFLSPQTSFPRRLSPSSSPALAA